ncbi:MAG: 50S ribosomal protein L30 [Desulfobacterales bacterium]|jgi:large subunit ribosomal protein L30
MAAKIKVTLVRSVVGKPEKHRKIVRGLGLRKMNNSVELEDTPSIRGMVNHIPHLVKVEEIQ